MADGPLTAAELRESTRLTARVVVVSACESGRIGIADAPNEFRGLPSALVACGAAAVVASLWPVDDMATSLLMVRFHEELLQLEAAAQEFSTDLVARALASAQGWLRGMSFAEMDDYIARHDLLSGRDAPGDQDRGLWTGVARRLRGGRPQERRPFADPRHWASFVAIG